MEQSEQAFKELCAKVEALDRKAASYLRRYARLLKGFAPCDHLANAFHWKRTVQGHDYWLQISRSVHGGN